MMQQCQKCKTWVESKDITTGGCVNCNSRSVISNGEDVVTGDDLWAEWDRKVQEAAEVIELVCKTRHNGSKGCSGCPLTLGAGRACSVGAFGIKPKDWRNINRSVPGTVSDTDTSVNFNIIPDNMWKDKLGGIHGEGIGYNPQGVFCGECTRETCEGCKHRDAGK